MHAADVTLTLFDCIRSKVLFFAEHFSINIFLSASYYFHTEHIHRTYTRAPRNHCSTIIITCVCSAIYVQIHLNATMVLTSTFFSPLPGRFGNTKNLLTNLFAYGSLKYLAESILVSVLELLLFRFFSGFGSKFSFTRTISSIQSLTIAMYARLHFANQTQKKVLFLINSAINLSQNHKLPPIPLAISFNSCEQCDQFTVIACNS